MQTKNKGTHINIVMTRRSWIKLDYILLHITQRGHNQKPCYFGEEDHQPRPYRLDNWRPI